MLPLSELKLGSIDAVNYRRRGQKELLQTILYKEQYLEQVVEEGKYFLIGEKGTGKTSYAVYLENSEYQGNRSKVIELNSTDYQKFISLKEAGHLSVSTYSDVWRIILLHLLSDAVAGLAQETVFNFHKFNSLRNAVNEYYAGAFKPEVDYSLELVENAERVIGIFAEHLKLGHNDKAQMTKSQSGFQISLFELQKQFEEALEELKLTKNITLFIDGIDIRPEEINYERYIECIRGLANAAWQLNTSFLSNIRDSKGRLKICLLMRPDILDQMGFQNLNAKVRDNGVVLNWQTTYERFETSSIYKMIGGILAKQQVQPIDYTVAWEKYFPYDLPNLRMAEKVDHPFVGLLRYSFYRPRDIVQYLKLMQESILQDDGEACYFSSKAFHDCEKDFSEYLLGEVRDYLGFYYGSVDFDQIVGFFPMFGGKSSFSWEEFNAAFTEYKLLINVSESTVDELKGASEAFLQFLYSLNVIGYLEPESFGGTFVHWCFRDRTPVKLRPTVRTGLRYVVHPGLARSLLVGRGGMSKKAAPKLAEQSNRRRRRRRRSGGQKQKP